MTHSHNHSSYKPNTATYTTEVQNINTSYVLMYVTQYRSSTTLPVPHAYTQNTKITLMATAHTQESDTCPCNDTCVWALQYS